MLKPGACAGKPNPPAPGSSADPALTAGLLSVPLRLRPGRRRRGAGLGSGSAGAIVLKPESSLNWRLLQLDSSDDFSEAWPFPWNRPAWMSACSTRPNSSGRILARILARILPWRPLPCLYRFPWPRSALRLFGQIAFLLSLSSLKSVSYHPPPFKRKTGADISRCS